MGQHGAYGQRLGDIFDLDQTPALVTRTLRKSEIAVTHIKCDRVNNGLTAPIPREDAFLVTLQLRECPRHDLWIDDRSTPSGHLNPGAVCIYDLRLNPIVNSVSPFENLHFYIPRSAFDTIADMEGCSRADAFRNEPGLGVEDQVVAGLGASLLPAFLRPAEANQLFVDHISLAAAGYVLRTYGAGVRRTRAYAHKLAKWQERRVKEILRSELGGDISVSHLAQECHLSVGEFSHAFKQTIGMPAHQWLLLQRVEQAKALLRGLPHLSVSEIATACGFADEVHFARTFENLVGADPTASRG